MTKLKRHTGELKMGDLERLVGVPRSTIQSYLKLGLLPPPRRVSPKLHLFGEQHLEALARIRVLRKDQQLSLSEVRKQLQPASGARRSSASPLTMYSASADSAGHDARREAILETATRLFARHGYERVRLIDVAQEVGVSKAALYRHFESKESLFVDCIDHIRWLMIPKSAREAGARDPDLGRRGFRRARAVLEHFSTYRMLTNLLSVVAHGDDSVLAHKAREALHRMVTDAMPDVELAIEQSVFRKSDAELHAYMLWGALIGIGDRLSLDSRYTLNDALKVYFEFISWGVLPRLSPTPSPFFTATLRFRVTDTANMSIEIAEIRVQGQPLLTVHTSRGTLQLELASIDALSFCHDTQPLRVKVALRNGEVFAATMSPDLDITGTTSEGAFSIAMRDVHRLEQIEAIDQPTSSP